MMTITWEWFGAMTLVSPWGQPWARGIGLALFLSMASSFGICMALGSFPWYNCVQFAFFFPPKVLDLIEDAAGPLIQRGVDLATGLNLLPAPPLDRERLQPTVATEHEHRAGRRAGGAGAAGGAEESHCSIPRSDPQTKTLACLYSQARDRDAKLGHRVRLTLGKLASIFLVAYSLRAYVSPTFQSLVRRACAARWSDP